MNQLNEFCYNWKWRQQGKKALERADIPTDVHIMRSNSNNNIDQIDREMKHTDKSFE